MSAGFRQNAHNINIKNTINLKALPDNVSRWYTLSAQTQTSTHRSVTCNTTMIKGICKPKAGILEEDILESDFSDSGLSVRTKLAAFLGTLETGNIYVCILYYVWVINPPLCGVYIRGDKSEKTAWAPDRLSRGGTNRCHLCRHCPACAHAGIHAPNYLLIPKAIISSCLLVYVLTSFWGKSRGLYSHVSLLYCQNVTVSNQLKKCS